MKRVALLSNAIPDAWLAPCGVEVVRQVGYARYEPVPLRAGMCGHLAYLPALLEDVDGVVLATTCDQMRRGAEWLDDASRVFLFDVPSVPCDALLRTERARLERWARGLAPRGVARDEVGGGAVEEVPPCAGGASVGVVGGHFCGDAAGVRRFFAQRAVRIDLWGCEGGEGVGDISQRPNTLFYARLDRVIRERSLDGLVVVRTTWCDLWRAAFARIQETVAVPVVEWVFDGSCAGQPALDARSVARLEAFCEVLNARKRGADEG